MPRARSHYEVLGVSPDAPSDEVRRAYRRLALVLHPDKRAVGVSEDEAKERFQRLVEAFKVSARSHAPSLSSETTSPAPASRPARRHPFTNLQSTLNNPRHRPIPPPDAPGRG